MHPMDTAFYTWRNFFLRESRIIVCRTMSGPERRAADPGVCSIRRKEGVPPVPVPPGRSSWPASNVSGLERAASPGGTAAWTGCQSAPEETR